MHSLRLFLGYSYAFPTIAERYFHALSAIFGHTSVAASKRTLLRMQRGVFVSHRLHGLHGLLLLHSGAAYAKGVTPSSMGL